MNVDFYLDAVEDAEATTREGHPIYREVEKVRITGMRDAFGSIDNTFTIDTIVGANHIHNFPDQYRAFKGSQREAAVGTPLKLWPALNVAQVKTLAAVGITTVEALAELDPKELRTREWLRPLHEKATSWLKSLTDNSEVLRLKARIEELERENEALRFDLSETVKSAAGRDKREKVAA